METIVGVNKYALDDEEDVDVLSIDNTTVLKSQLERLERVKVERDEDAVQKALAALTASAEMQESTSHGENPNNLLRLSIEAARVRCTLGEISARSKPRLVAMCPPAAWYRAHTAARTMTMSRLRSMAWSK